MADVVVYEDSPLAQYLNEIQGEQQGTDLQHTTVPVNDPEPPTPFVGFRIAHNAVDVFTHFVEYLTHTFSSSATDKEDTEFEERFKYFICTSPFLNRTATLHTHERGRRTDATETLEYTSKFNPGRFGYALGFGTLATLIARSILQRRNIKATQYQALQSLQKLVNHCQSLDIKVNRAIMVIQEIELVSRGYRLSTPLAPISRIEQASKTRRCNIVRAQLIAALAKSGTLFQKSTETLQSHIDYKRLSTLLDMYNIAPSPPRSNSPGINEGADPIPRRSLEHRHVTLPTEINTAVTDNDNLTLTASPTSDLHSPLPSTFSHHIRQRSSSKRTSRNFNVPSRQNSRPNSFHEIGHTTQFNVDLSGPSSGRRSTRRHRTSWSASEGEESDNGTTYVPYSPRSSTYSNIDGSPTLINNIPEMTSLERLRKNFQKMHVHRREFLCELMSIRRKSRNGRHGLSALKDYDQNWIVVRDVLQKGVTGIEAVVDELSKVLDSELYTLPRIDTQVNKSESSAQDKQLQPFVHRIALLEQHVRGVQAKLFICNEDIRETIREDPMDVEKRRLLELQFDSISEDISMMATDWQLGKTALTHVFEPSAARLALEQEQERLKLILAAAEQENQNLGDETRDIMGPIIDSMEPLDDQQRLIYLAAKREETWEASTESELGGFSSRRTTGFVGADGVKMTRAERIQQQKMLREQEELKKERVYDNSKMVNELKGVLGRRRNLRENDEDDQKDQQQQSASELGLSSTVSTLDSIVRGYSVTNSSITSITGEESSSSPLPNEHISPLSLSEPVFAREFNSFAATLEQEFEEQVEGSYVEISGVGEAEEEEEEDVEVEDMEESSSIIPPSV
ncbi:hypothetical protein BGX27_009113 [Mortierella sp. AM989]|nr:hypothetical protein BGX27_009113 [Mortierella sp. AM989]